MVRSESIEGPITDVSNILNIKYIRIRTYYVCQLQDPLSFRRHNKSKKKQGTHD